MVSQSRGSTCTRGSSVRPNECSNLAVAALDQHLNIPIQGTLSQIAVFRSLVGMAAMEQSIHTISALLAQSPCGTSLRYHLVKLRMADLEAVNATILASALSSVLTPGNAYTCAIDFTNDTHFGAVVAENEEYSVRSRLK